MSKCVLFDLDETLFDRTQTLRQFLATQFMRFQGVLGDVDCETWLERFVKMDARGATPKRALYPEILKVYGGRLSRADDLIRDYYERSTSRAIAMPGMTELLSELEARRVPVGIITNGETDLQTRTLKALGLIEQVPMILISEAFGEKKPAPEIFHAAARNLSAVPGECLFVGDNPSADVLGAFEAGMQTAWFNPAGGPWPEDLPPNPGVELGHLLDVLPLI